MNAKTLLEIIISSKVKINKSMELMILQWSYIYKIFFLFIKLDTPDILFLFFIILFFF